MRILFVCGDHGVPAFGRKGASTHLREMIAALRRAGCEVALAAADLSGDRRPDEDFPTFELPRPTSKLLGADGRYVAADIRADAALRDACRSFAPDAIYERSALYFLAGERLAASARLPRLLEVNTLLAEEMRTRLHFPAWATARERRLLTRAPGIAAISGTMRERLVGEFSIPGDRVRVFTMAVDPRRFRPTGRREELRARIGVAPDVPLVGFIGSMNHYHRPGWFLEVLERLAASGTRAAAVAVGGSDSKVERSRERAAAFADRLPMSFLGSVPQEELVGWIEAIDLVIVPGAAPQSTPTKIFEVAAIGTPILLPATDPIRALCKGGAEGLLFDPERIEDLEAQVRGWLADPATLAGSAGALKERVLADFTWDSHARRVLDWYREPVFSRG